ncbi:hypothetical protein [Paenibacillus sp. Leaf72]|uniref:hypothetical protein n=1 Tax=Paenibacillus sp. Leaf72 TaxID=1736234 RepID=UPI000700E5E6|nr:hypothetical protein [Paenibacillus sp. Leaf72]KQN96839.1 hypothetical protein ASF12_22470 [Paenibacillus sp. Leaf72]
MKTKLGEYSINTMIYFALQATMFCRKNKKQNIANYEFFRIVATALDEWMPVFGQDATRDEVMAVKEDLRRELRQGDYLVDGKDSFCNDFSLFVEAKDKHNLLYKYICDILDSTLDISEALLWYQDGHKIQSVESGNTFKLEDLSIGENVSFSITEINGKWVLL